MWYGLKVCSMGSIKEKGQREHIYYEKEIDWKMWALFCS